MADDLNQMIESNPDPRELKRAIAVQMVLSGLKHRQIQSVLSVSSGFISKWTQLYEQGGADCLKLGYHGSSGYLTTDQRTQAINWIQSKESWNLLKLQSYLEEEYQVVFKSKQSYYDLFTEAGLSWKRSQKCNPKTDAELVKKKRSNSRSGWSPDERRLKQGN